MGSSFRHSGKCVALSGTSEDMAGRDRSAEDHDGTAGTPKTAQHKHEGEGGLAHRHDGSGRPSHETGSHDKPGADHTTVTESSRKSAAKVNSYDVGRTEPDRPNELEEQDFERIPSLRQTAQRERGDNAS